MMIKDEARDNRSFIRVQTAVIALGLIGNAVAFSFYAWSIQAKLSITPSQVRMEVSSLRDDFHELSTSLSLLSDEVASLRTDVRGINSNTRIVEQ